MTFVPPEADWPLRDSLRGCFAAKRSASDWLFPVVARASVWDDPPRLRCSRLESKSKNCPPACKRRWPRSTSTLARWLGSRATTGEGRSCAPSMRQTLKRRDSSERVLRSFRIVLVGAEFAGLEIAISLRTSSSGRRPRPFATSMSTAMVGTICCFSTLAIVVVVTPLRDASRWSVSPSATRQERISSAMSSRGGARFEHGSWTPNPRVTRFDEQTREPLPMTTMMRLRPVPT
jgi:hypothetical protein